MDKVGDVLRNWHSFKSFKDFNVLSGPNQPSEPECWICQGAKKWHITVNEGEDQADLRAKRLFSQVRRRVKSDFSEKDLSPDMEVHNDLEHFGMNLEIDPMMNRLSRDEENILDIAFDHGLNDFGADINKWLKKHRSA